MRTYIIAALFASVQSIKLTAEWESVAKCKADQISTNEVPCDHNNINDQHLGLNQKKWESVARCKPGQISSDSKPCDHDNHTPHNLDGTNVQTNWESVARCKAGQTSTDSQPCDHHNNMDHSLDGTVGTLVQINQQWRPVIKCKEDSHGNPVTCDYNDVTSLNDAPARKDENGFTPTKTVLGGPLQDNTPPPPKTK